ncbi:hypothetical protein B5F83_09520 [Muribaculum sp. An289]|jgi:ATP-dependent RNA helicase DeaD|uniref:RNA helicase n=1 Tax=Candidatus Merdivivens faecigallinarum TaxID=2840871 RepID=A0A9D9J0J9_9BACT|nr:MULTISPECIES: DEAD/DEAH box helicase [unclassified Muribaculum]MBO8481435.1 DEAD/DEAH box helicase [Candidatus Merdivivens faecigallinarum]OUO36145.1 hypothetical protein B5F83_09520 [Muribaculum sp. An289]OUO41101.1 hypothetical protein B5F81_09515 [Muribaculum sp. An287]
MVTSFLDLGLSNELLNAVAELGFEKPTPVQARIIPTLLAENKDVVCLAQTGTGKTAAFGLPTLEYLDTENKDTQVLVLSPTRELCRQITQDLENYSKYKKGVRIVSLYGGANIVAQMRSLKDGANIIVATPGRLLDILKRGKADISHISTLILDEADEMLDMGFKDDLDAILESAPKERRTLLFSATLPKEVEAIARNYMTEPEIVTVGTRNAGAENVEHFYYMIREEDRYEALKRIADFNPDIYGIVFCKTREETQKIADALQRDGYDADALHGDLSQAQRDYVMGKFKRKALHLLVATDVAARGIDVNGLSHVINYNLPQEIELYTHRSGRTGRADRKGISIAIINQREKGKLRRIEQVIKKEFTRLPIPSAREICEKQLLHLINGINAVEVRKDLYSFQQLINEQWSEIPKEELIEKMLSYEFNRFFDYYRKAKDINITDKPEGKKSSIRKDEDTGKDRGRGRRESRRQKEKNFELGKCEDGFSWVRVNLGYKHKVTPRLIIDIMKECGANKKDVGRIEITNECLFAAVKSNIAGYVASEIDGATYRRHKLRADIWK